MFKNIKKTILGYWVEGKNHSKISLTMPIKSKSTKMKRPFFAAVLLLNSTLRLWAWTHGTEILFLSSTLWFFFLIENECNFFMFPAACYFIYIIMGSEINLQPSFYISDFQCTFGHFCCASMKCSGSLLKAGLGLSWKQPESMVGFTNDIMYVMHPLWSSWAHEYQEDFVDVHFTPIFT